VDARGRHPRGHHVARHRDGVARRRVFGHPAVIPALRAYLKIVAVKKPVVEIRYESSQFSFTVGLNKRFYY